MRIFGKQLELAYVFFAAGFFTSTWDLLLRHEVAGFTLKIYQPLMLGAALGLLWQNRREGPAAFLAPLFTPFAACFFLLGTFYLGSAPWSAFPVKSLLYSLWLFFDLTVVWLSFQHIGRTHSPAVLFRLAWATMLFLSGVILIDQVAYRFGYIGGILGFNQDILLHWGVSRPHAFSSEPSYVATFLSLGLLTTATQIFALSRRKWLFWLGFLTIIFTDLATTSRTGWFTLALGFPALFLLPHLMHRKSLIRPLVAFLAVVALAVTLFYATTPASQRRVMDKSLVSGMMTGQDGSGNSRLRSLLLAVEIGRETHWLGTGLGASYRYYIQQGHADYNARNPFSHSVYGNELIMSTWGQLMAEGGLVAVALYALAAFFLVRKLFERWKVEENDSALGPFVAALVFFGFTSLWLGNVCRGDVWVWYGLWAAVVQNRAA